MLNLLRKISRLQAAFASTNRCPLGACAITGTGFPIDRQRTSGLLGFDGPTGNTYGSIATVDYLLESVAASRAFGGLMANSVLKSPSFNPACISRKSGAM